MYYQVQKYGKYLENSIFFRMFAKNTLFRMSENVLFKKGCECMKKEDYSQAKVFFEKALKDGCTEAYYKLGQLCYFGLGVEQDYKSAIALYKKGAKAGDADCMECLGICYYWGHGTEPDVQKAAYYNEKAADMGLPDAMFDTGLNYENGWGVQQDINKALYWLEKAATNGYARAFTELGNIYFTGVLLKKDLKKSIDYYQQGAELGDNESRIALAEFYEEGNVVKKDTDKARCLYRDAFDSLHELATVYDDCDAQLSLGRLFFYGQPLLGIPVNYNQAVQWLLKAAQKGNDLAENNLGLMYEFGLGVGQNYKIALDWYSKAAARMNVVALSNIGNCYYLGRGTAQDYVKAADYHSKAANLGYANSQEVFGEMYLEGKGVVQNYTKAFYWLKKACENGERSAFSHLGDCYRKGFGVEKNEKKAFELYIEGAEQDDLRSKVFAAQCMIEGWGTSQDFAKAFQILKDICNDEAEYREQLVTMTMYEGKNGYVLLNDPLDEETLKYYAKAYFMLALLYYSGSGAKKDGGEAIRLLRVAEKLGYDEKWEPDKGKEENIEKLLDKIKKESVDRNVHDTVDCFVEVREIKRRGERYDVVIHHADETETVVDFKGRNKFFYVLALLTVYEGSSVCGLTTNHFSLMHDVLCRMASDFCVKTYSYEDWIDEFIYVEKPESTNQREKGDKNKTYCYCSLCPDKYSNAFSGANRAISKFCTDEEYETLKLRSMGRKPAVTTISISSSQIILPDSLKDYLDNLPTSHEIYNHKPKGVKRIPLKV